MARKTGQIIGRGPRTWLVRVLRGTPRRRGARTALETYSHVLPHMQDATATKVEALLFPLATRAAADNYTSIAAPFFRSHSFLSR
jgi:hypothetical protein